MTQLDFEGRCGGYDTFNRVVMISCVGARNEERSYCGRFCCIVALKNAILVKEANPRAEVTILHRDVMAVGKLYEDYYRRALEKGITFVRFDKAQPPQVIGTGGRAEKVRVLDTLMGREIELGVDLVLLTTPLVPASDNGVLSQMMKIPLGMDGFFLEAHQKLRPVEFPTDGIFVAGCARYPAEISESIAQALAAAAKAAVPMARGAVVSDAFVAEVDPTLCSACGRCLQVCPFGAVDWSEVGATGSWKGAGCEGQCSRMQGLRSLRLFLSQRSDPPVRIYG
jgi:heterodisulfide reductase subunit A2